MFESPYLLWLKRADLPIPNHEFSLTFLRGDVNTCASLQTGYVAFRQLDKLFWRQSWC